MTKQYYSLVAGLREYQLDADNKGFDAPAIVGEVREELSGGDLRHLALFYTYYDIGNIISLLAGRAQFSALGNFTREELVQEMKTPSQLPRFVSDILAAYANPDDPEYDEVDRTKAVEKALFTAYYAECERSKCRFLRDWYTFDRNLRNVTAAYNARRLGLSVADEVVGAGYVAETMGRSSAADFGLRGELDYLDRVLAAMGEEGNLLDKERQLDLLRWDMADELTTFDYFNLNKVLAYLAKVNIIYRWVSLDAQTGREMFQRLMAEMSGEEKLREAEAER
ncbi:DUF2764 domain-containing protein [Alistipes sp. OttesenSCG-928-B03]|nr:DUF2764 domain-containing protein [Alistipes sp. OttesenSCG-928-B03]